MEVCDRGNSLENKTRSVDIHEGWVGGQITWSSALLALRTARRSWQSPSWPLENLKAARISLRDGEVVCVGLRVSTLEGRERERAIDLLEGSPRGVDEVLGVGGRVHGWGR